MVVILRPLVKAAILKALDEGNTELLDFLIEDSRIQDFQLEPYGIKLPELSDFSIERNQIQQEIIHLGPSAQAQERVRKYFERYGGVH